MEANSVSPPAPGSVGCSVSRRSGVRSSVHGPERNARGASSSFARPLVQKAGAARHPLSGNPVAPGGSVMSSLNSSNLKCHLSGAHIILRILAAKHRDARECGERVQHPGSEDMPLSKSFRFLSKRSTLSLSLSILMCSGESASNYHRYLSIGRILANVNRIDISGFSC